MLTRLKKFILQITDNYIISYFLSIFNILCTVKFNVIEKSLKKLDFE
jgi:hypothetical protein